MPIKLNGQTSGSVQLDVPAAVSGGDVSLTLPNGIGSANQFLKNGSTAGTLEFADAAALTSSDMPTGSILQVKETHLDTAFSVSYSTHTDTDITGLSVTLTPASTNSKVLIFARVNFELNNTSNQDFLLNLKRGSTFVGRPAADGVRTLGLQGMSQGHVAANADTTMDNSYFHFLDSPGTASSITYQLNMRNGFGSIMYVNRTVNDSNANTRERTTSSIIAMEVA